MSLNEDLYKEIIIEHSQNPSNREPVPGANIIENGVNRSCGDEVELQIQLEDGAIQKIGVLGRGCSISIASASMMGEMVEGLSVVEARELIAKFKGMLLEKKEIEFPPEQEDLVALSGVQKYPIRVKCATLPWNTLEQAIQSC